jgi:hypothetical protein
MKNRRDFMKKAALGGIAGIIATGKAPAFAEEMKMLKIGQPGIGSHYFASVFNNPSPKYKDIVRCKPYAVWDETPGVAEKMTQKMGFKKVCKSPEEVVKESDVILIEYPDFRRVLEFARPALEAGKPVFMDRPFIDSVANAEEIVRLSKANNAPIMCGSSLEFQIEIPEIKKFVAENGPVRAYEAYCPEPFFSWMFPHVINYAHSALGGGIESAFFAGNFVNDVLGLEKDKNKFVIPGKPMGSALSVLTYKSRNGEPPIIGMNHIGQCPGSYHITVYAYNESRQFISGAELDDPKVFVPMFLTLNEFYSTRVQPRPYEAILEQHRAHVATNVSRLSGKTVTLDSLKGSDSLPYSDSFMDFALKHL